MLNGVFTEYFWLYIFYIGSELRVENKAEHPTPRKPSVQISGMVQPLQVIGLALSLGAHVL